MYDKIIEKKIVGAKQTLRAVNSDIVETVYVASDAEVRITKSVLDACILHGVEVIYVDTMQKLGIMCSIDVGTAIACVLKRC